MYSDSHTNKTKKETIKKIHQKTKRDTSLFLFSNMKVKSLQL
jgi:hypothetical protein